VFDRDVNLRVPGPTPVPADVALAGAQPMVNHRGPEFAATMAEVCENLKPFFGTQHEPLLLTGSGTGGQEAAIVNMLSPGDEVLAVTMGVFGDRFAAIAEAFGANVTRLEVDWGGAVDPAAVGQALRDHPRLKAVLLTHNETSTGVTMNLPAVAQSIRTASGTDEPLIMVDGVSSIGALPFEMDVWDVDVAITGSQKAWMCPPGMSMIGVSPRAWATHDDARMPRFYWDFSKAKKNAERRTTPFTPAVGVVQAMRAALRRMLAEGPEGVYSRHRRIGRQMREGVLRLGLQLFADPAVASDTVTAVRVNGDIDAAVLIKSLRQRGVVVANGQDWLKGSIFRVGHMGWVDEADIDLVLGALDGSLVDARMEQAV
jgi:aspartate aminotransferase-like enzyme